MAGWQSVEGDFIPCHEIVQYAVDGEVCLFPGSVCGEVQWDGEVLVGNDVSPEPGFELSGEGLVAQVWQGEWFVVFWCGAVAKVEDIA